MKDKRTSNLNFESIHILIILKFKSLIMTGFHIEIFGEKREVKYIFKWTFSSIIYLIKS